MSERKQFADALQLFVRLTEIVPLIYVGWEQRGICEISLMQPKVARESFMTVSCLAPHLSFPICNIAISFYLEDKPEVALHFLDDMIEIKQVEDLHTLAWLKGFIQEKKGQKDEAFVSYLQSQLMAKTNIQKHFTASKMYDITSKIVEDPEESEDSEEK